MLFFELSNFRYFPYVHAYGKYSDILLYIILYILYTIYHIYNIWIHYFKYLRSLWLKVRHISSEVYQNKKKNIFNYYLIFLR